MASYAGPKSIPGGKVVPIPLAATGMDPNSAFTALLRLHQRLVDACGSSMSMSSQPGPSKSEKEALLKDLPQLRLVVGDKWFAVINDQDNFGVGLEYDPSVRRFVAYMTVNIALIDE